MRLASYLPTRTVGKFLAICSVSSDLCINVGNELQITLKRTFSSVHPKTKHGFCEYHLYGREQMK